MNSFIVHGYKSLSTLVYSCIALILMSASCLANITITLGSNEFVDPTGQILKWYIDSDRLDGNYVWQHRQLSTHLLFDNNLAISIEADRSLDFNRQLEEIRLSGMLYEMYRSGETPSNVSNDRFAEEIIFYKRIINRRKGWLARIISGSEYPHRLGPSRFFEKYYINADKWIEAVEAYRHYIEQPDSEPETIALLLNTIKIAEDEWNIESYRKIITLISLRYRSILNTKSSVIWSKSEQSYIENGGIIYVSKEASPRVDIVVENGSWSKVTLFDSSGQPHEMMTSLAIIQRSWMDHDAVYLRKWKWSDPSLRSDDYIFSDGDRCGGYLYTYSCIAQRVVLVNTSGNAGLEENTLITGFVGENLRRTPPSYHGDEQDEIGSGWHPYPRRDVGKRLRNNTF